LLMSERFRASKETRRPSAETILRRALA